MYDKPNNETFINKTEKAQYDAALAITGTIKGTSREKLYAELFFFLLILFYFSFTIAQKYK